MRLFLIYAILLVSTKCFADTVTIDSSTWNQDQKNMTAAMSYQLLYKAGITYQKVNVNLPTIEVVGNSAPIDSVLTKQTIEDEYAAWKVIIDAANAAEQQKFQAMQTELNTHEMKKISLVDIDSKIDSISNLSQAKAFLKRLTHYLWAKGYFENE